MKIPNLRFMTTAFALKATINEIKLTPCQKKFQSLINDKTIPIVFGVGASGTGKTMVTVNESFDLLKRNKVKKIIITRPVISVDEEIGFLPGTLNEKMSPWVNPIFDYFNEIEPRLAQNLMSSNQLEIVPLAFIRGRTFNNACIIGDEMQNATPIQMKALLTRIGRNSKIIISGDLQQSDLEKENGLYNILKLIKNKYEYPNDMYDDGIGIVNFDKSEIMRNPVIKNILDLYDLQNNTI
jgi:phosphate starvation-inducible PhoH-like protein